MSRPEESTPAFQENRALVLLLIAVSAALVWILLPFYGTILWSSIIALLFGPLNRWFLQRLHSRRTPAALCTLLVAVLTLIIPFALVSAILAREALLVYERLQAGEWNVALHLHRLFDALPLSMMAALDQFGLADFDALQRRLIAVLSQANQLIAKRALGLGQDTFEFVAELFVTAYIAFFLIRDGDELVRTIGRAIPLASEHKKVLFEKFTTVIRATVKGNLLVAAIQGALGGVAFWFLGVSAAFLWAALMAFLSLLPAVGAALVWLPVAIYFLIAGETWQGFALIAYGILVIGLVDNLLRPILVGRDTRMPDYVVMITTLGGIAALGINGLVVGPVIAAMFIAIWHLYAAMQTDTGA